MSTTNHRLKNAEHGISKLEGRSIGNTGAEALKEKKWKLHKRVKRGMGDPGKESREGGENARKQQERRQWLRICHN